MDMQLTADMPIIDYLTYESILWLDFKLIKNICSEIHFENRFVMKLKIETCVES